MARWLALGALGGAALGGAATWFCLEVLLGGLVVGVVIVLVGLAVGQGQERARLAPQGGDVEACLTWSSGVAKCRPSSGRGAAW